MGDLGKLIGAKGFKKMPKVQKSPNLVTLLVSDTGIRTHDLLDMSLLPYPLDQGTRLRLSIFDLFLIFRTVRPNLFENTYRHRDLIPRWLQSLLFSRGAPQLMWDEGSYLSNGKLLC